MNSMAGAYPHVSTPLQIGSATLPNRIVRTAHGTGMASLEIGDELVAFHVARARGGVGLTMLEATSVHHSGFSPTGMRSWDDSAIEGYAVLQRALVDYPMQLMVQLFHGGFTAPPFDGSAPWSASAIPSPAALPSPIAAASRSMPSRSSCSPLIRRLNISINC